jgi:hypothetical protein
MAWSIRKLRGSGFDPEGEDRRGRRTGGRGGRGDVAHVNERTPGPAHVATAAIVIGGVLILVMPQHGMSILRLVAVTVAAAACLHAFTVNAPPTWWKSPFDRGMRAGQRRQPEELDWIRAGLSGRRQQVVDGPPLPPGTLRLLQPLIRSALEQEGVDPDEADGGESAGALLSPLARGILVTQPLPRPTRAGTIGPDEWRTADAVQSVLDELARLDSGGCDPEPRTRTPDPLVK